MRGGGTGEELLVWSRSVLVAAMIDSEAAVLDRRRVAQSREPATEYSIHSSSRIRGQLWILKRRKQEELDWRSWKGNNVLDLMSLSTTAAQRGALALRRAVPMATPVRRFASSHAHDDHHGDHHHDDHHHGPVDNNVYPKEGQSTFLLFTGVNIY